MKRLLTRANIIAFLIIFAPGINALADYVGGELSLRSAIKATLTGCTAAAVTFFMAPPKKRSPGLPIPPEQKVSNR